MSAVRETILNNYLAVYGTPGTQKSNRFDSHKKSELRNTYNSIVRMNKESPWYLPVTSRETQNYAVSLKEGARELRSSIAELGGLEEDGLFDKKHASSSKESVATAAYIGSERDTSDVPSFDLEVKSLASGQRNGGRWLPNEPVALPEDTYSFDVNINDMNYEFQFYISEGETAREVQDRLARLINNSGIGLKASIDGSPNGSSSLQIQSEATGLPSLGKDRIFTISDERTSKTSGAVDYFGLDNLSTRPQNAVFSVNGEERTTNSNHFTVGKLYDIELNGTTGEGESVRIGLKTNVESVTENVSQLIGSYNSFLQSVNSYLDSQAKSKQLAGELTGIADRFKDSLGNLGINLTDDGALQIDEDRLKTVADESENVKETFGTLKDFAGSLLKKSNQVALNPMDYVNRTIVAYKNPGHNFASPYTTSSYSGMMFNYFC